jgi:preprotein translocase subunit SecG
MLMQSLVFGIQILSGIITSFFVLVHDPKSEGLGAIGSAASSFRGIRTTADEKLDRITWFFAGIFLLSSALLGLGIVK